MSGLPVYWQRPGDPREMPEAAAMLEGVRQRIVEIIALQPTVTTWIANRDPSRVLVAAALFYGTGIAMHGLATGLALHAAAVMVWTLGEIIESPARSSIVATMAPADARGRYQGALVMTWGAAQLVGPKLGTWVWEYEGPSTLWLSCFVLGVVVALALAGTTPARRRRMASPEQRGR